MENGNSFLLVHEEMVDSTRHGFFGDAELVRIYYGTLHLGINFRDAKPGWAKLEGDSFNCHIASD